MLQRAKPPSPCDTGDAGDTATAGLLQLLWLASPALPVGGFSYSETLEAAVERGDVASEAACGPWLVHQLRIGLARADLAVVALALTAWRHSDSERVQQLNDWVLQTRESSELRLQTEQMGRSMMEWLRNREPTNTALTTRTRSCTSPTYPVAFALAAALTRAPAQDCLLSYGFGWAENMVQAAVKSVPLGQAAGQRILAQLVAALPTVVEQALALDDIPALQAFSPMLAILSAQHETQYSRLFRS